MAVSALLTPSLRSLPPRHSTATSRRTPRVCRAGWTDTACVGWQGDKLSLCRDK
jgi:hypothetical protein